MLLKVVFDKRAIVFHSIGVDCPKGSPGVKYWQLIMKCSHKMKYGHAVENLFRFNIQLVFIGTGTTPLR